MWNPLRTLAGRLVLVTIGAIALSYAAVFTIFANERGASLRRFAESAIAERVAYTARRLRDAPPAERPALADNLRDFGIRYRITREPTLPDSVAPQRLARLVSDALGGAEVRARLRVAEVEPPRRWRRFSHMAEGETAIVVGAPDGEARDVVRLRMPDGAPPRFRATVATLAIALGPASWLEARARLPAPRPVPASYFWAALASMIAVGLGATLVARQIGRPLADLAGAAQRLGAGETAVSAPVRGPDDVRRASTAFNDMAARLGRQLARQRQMLWALSHDLRTPITALRLRAELLEDEAAKQKILQPLAEMETLTEQALALARAGASEETREVVDIAEIARTLCGELQELGLPIRVEAEAPVRVACRPAEIARALRNLAENAARHAGGGTMRVTAGTRGGAIVQVTDAGPGISEAELRRVTEPFYRADAARSAGSGAGLGLAIVQAIADGHGGRLTLENRQPHGLAATLHLPA